MLSHNNLRETESVAINAIKDAYANVTWKYVDVRIEDANGDVIFEQEAVECPESWTNQSVQIVANKYFRGQQGTERRETSIFNLAHRVCSRICDWGVRDGYFDLQGSRDCYTRLMDMVLSQRFFWNSPVWFNLGAEGRSQQASACFINSVEDNMESILALGMTEGILFKGGSGTGSNMSKLRAQGEPLSTGGTSTGPLSFMRGLDAWAGAIKSGGATRRAARMMILDVDHPDIQEFITCKVTEDEKAKKLIAAGYTPGLNGEAYASVFHQNANHSVRVTDGFMSLAVTDDVTPNWNLTRRTDGGVAKKVNAAALLKEVAEAAYACGDPGLQYDDTIQKWHTSGHVDRIRASNPCCFVGETRVDTSEGRVEIQELSRKFDANEGLPYAYSYDIESRLPVLKKIQAAWVSGHTNKLVKVTTDKGIVLTCTPEHKFLVRTHGVDTYVEAQDLEEGARLRKIGKWRNALRSDRGYINQRPTDKIKSGTQVLARWMWTQVHGDIPEGMHVHHVDGKATNDFLSNLTLEEHVEHVRSHSAGEKNPRYIDVPEELLVSTWEDIESKPRGTHTSVESAVTPGRWNKHIHDEGLKGIVPLAASSPRGGKIRGMAWDKFSDWISSRRDLTNDRVASVEHITLEEAVPVYDITVEGTHNFGVSSFTDTGTHSVVVANSEYLFLDDTACNLGSFNLLKYYNIEDNTFDISRFVQDVEYAVLSMDIIVGGADYPTAKIAENSILYRTLGLGYTNLGALLMSMGVPYNSVEGRAVAASLASLLTATGYKKSISLTWDVGTAKGVDPGNMREVLRLHENAHSDLEKTVQAISSPGVITTLNLLALAASDAWSTVVTSDVAPRNAQISVIAPTGTISFAMGCDTTGCEPELALRKFKTLVGGGVMQLANPTVIDACRRRLHKSEEDIEAIEAYVLAYGTLQGCNKLSADEQRIFQCSFESSDADFDVALPWSAHIDMLEAIQPFISGSISKTVNLPSSATVEDILDIYETAWTKGLKCVAVYRDGSKDAQPLRTGKSYDENAGRTAAPVGSPRKRLPDTRPGQVHKFTIGGFEGYVTTGFYPSGGVGEVFINCSKEGSTISGLLDAVAVMMSIGLQHGVPLDAITTKLRGANFAPQGITQNENIRFASSIVDYVARYLDQLSSGEVTVRGLTQELVQYDEVNFSDVRTDFGDNQPCHNCGGIAIRAGSCYTCQSCGETTGCG